MGRKVDREVTASGDSNNRKYGRGRNAVKKHQPFVAKIMGPSTQESQKEKTDLKRYLLGRKNPDNSSSELSITVRANGPIKPRSYDREPERHENHQKTTRKHRNNNENLTNNNDGHQFSNNKTHNNEKTNRNRTTKRHFKLNTVRSDDETNNLIPRRTSPRSKSPVVEIKEEPVDSPEINRNSTRNNRGTNRKYKNQSRREVFDETKNPTESARLVMYEQAKTVTKQMFNFLQRRKQTECYQSYLQHQITGIGTTDRKFLMELTDEKMKTCYLNWLPENADDTDDDKTNREIVLNYVKSAIALATKFSKVESLEIEVEKLKIELNRNNERAETTKQSLKADHKKELEKTLKDANQQSVVLKAEIEKLKNNDKKKEKRIEMLEKEVEKMKKSKDIRESTTDKKSKAKRNRQYGKNRKEIESNTKVEINQSEPHIEIQLENAISQ